MINTSMDIINSSLPNVTPRIPKLFEIATARLSNADENVTYFASIENTTLWDELETDDSHASFFSAPVWLVALMIGISTWIIVSNALVFLCLVTSRNALKNNVNVQLLCLSLTDMLVGITTIPGALLPLVIHNVRYETCAFLIYMYFVAQVATLFHALLICINRLKTIRRKANVSESDNETFKTIFRQIMLVWLGSFSYFGIHFLFFARFGETLTQCSTTHLFEDYQPVALGVITIPLLIPTQISINIIYVYLLMYLRKKLKTIHVAQAMPKRQIKDNGLTSDQAGNNRSTKNVQTERDVHTSQKALTKTSDSIISDPIAKVLNTNSPKAGPSNASESISCEDNQVNAPNTNLKDKNETDHNHTNTNKKRKGLEKQRRVLVTFGILLMCLNVTMTPIDFISLIEMNGLLPRRLRFVVMLMGMLNSALNPVINIWRITPFRVIMREKAANLYEYLRFWRA